MLMLFKNYQRVYFRSLRKRLDIKQQNVAALSIANLVFYYDLLKNANNIAIFLPFDGEINTYPLILNLWKKKFNVFLPVLPLNMNTTLLFLKYECDSVMHLNKFNILEPVFHDNQCISLNELDLIVVPLVAFDRYGNRLGMG